MNEACSARFLKLDRVMAWLYMTSVINTRTQHPYLRSLGNCRQSGPLRPIGYPGQPTGVPLTHTSTPTSTSTSATKTLLVALPLSFLSSDNFPPHSLCRAPESREGYSSIYLLDGAGARRDDTELPVSHLIGHVALSRCGWVGQGSARQPDT